MITCKRLKEILTYDEVTGIFTRNVTISKYKAGTIAGSIDSSGYVALTIDGYRTYAHRLAWLYMTGEFPNNEIDHIDGNKSNNSIKNLRDVKRDEQSKNMPKYSNNGSQCIGVVKRQDCNRWVAKIRVNNKNIYLGMYKTYEEAVIAREAANVKYGFSTNHGRLQEMAA